MVIDNKELIKVESAKYLGVIIDRKLNWIDHITYVKNKISKGIGIMYKALCLLCSVVYTCVTVYATSLYNVNKLVTCCYSI